MILPRRLLRVIIYVMGATMLILLALFSANRRRMIHLDDFLPNGLLPSYFQPPSDTYIVDIAIGECNVFNQKSRTCGKPKASDGHYADVGSGGGWFKVKKDLLLSKHWSGKRFIYVKRISSEYYEAHRDTVVLDIAVGNRDEDCRIKGNKNCIPKSILTAMSMDHVFDGNDLEDLISLNKNEPLKLKPDGTNSANKYIKEYEQLREDGKVSDKSIPQMSEAKGEPVSENSVKEDPNAPNPDQKKTDTKHEKDTVDGEKSNTKEKMSKRDHTAEIKPREVERSHDNLKSYLRIPSSEEIEAAGWHKREHNIWVKLGPATNHAVTGVDVLFGEDAVDPRPNWFLIKEPLTNLGASRSLAPKITYRKGSRVDYKQAKYQPELAFRSNGKFKVLQVADLHFSTGTGKCRDPEPESSAKDCQADPRTLKFLSQVLDLEKPDFVVMTGDQVFGDAAPDPETALFKAVNPFIKRKIPFAITMGNHDDESIMPREQMMRLASSLPYSFSDVGPRIVAGYGNYAVPIKRSRGTSLGAVFYFLDSHSRSKQPKTNPGYDWFKETQVDWLQMQALAKKESSKEDFLSMAFFHIPIPEYRKVDQPMVGQHREGITASKYKTKMREALGTAGVSVVSCGHDHANDFCLFDTENVNTESGTVSQMWLCYGGGAGEGGYGGYGGYIRRVRVFELDTSSMGIRTWKRAENDPNLAFDEQLIVERGKAKEIMS